MCAWLGRLIRDIQRKIAGKSDLEAAFKVALERAETIFGQQPDDKAKLYALSAPEVECIGKGKARTRYEFGVKIAIATTNERARGGQFVLGIMALPGAPYDGHTLAGQIHQVGKLTGVDVKRAYVDRGYRGHKIERDGLLERNHLAGPQGDAINAIVCAAGHNLRLLARWLRQFLLQILRWALFARSQPAIQSPR